MLLISSLPHCLYTRLLLHLQSISVYWFFPYVLWLLFLCSWLTFEVKQSFLVSSTALCPFKPSLCQESALNSDASLIVFRNAQTLTLLLPSSLLMIFEDHLFLKSMRSCLVSFCSAWSNKTVDPSTLCHVFTLFLKATLSKTQTSLSS